MPETHSCADSGWLLRYVLQGSELGKARELAPPEEPPEFVPRVEREVGRIDAGGKAAGNRGTQRRKESIDERLGPVALRRAHAEVDDVDLNLCSRSIRPSIRRRRCGNDPRNPAGRRRSVKTRFSAASIAFLAAVIDTDTGLVSDHTPRHHQIAASPSSEYSPSGSVPERYGYG